MKFGSVVQRSDRRKLVLLRISRPAFSIVAFSALSSCGVVDSGQRISWLVQIGDMGECRAWAETTYRILESKGMTTEILQLASGLRTSKEANHETLEQRPVSLKDYKVTWNKSLFVQQSNPDLCWAAATTMAFAHAGVKYRQEDFSDALRAQCGHSLVSHATLNQIIFALTKVHTGTGTWIAEPTRKWSLDYQPPAQATSFMGRHVTWGPQDPQAERHHGVFSLISTGDLVEQIQSKRPVVLGYGTHVVLIIGVQVQTPHHPNFGEELPPSVARFFKLDSFIVIDPLESGSPKFVDAEFILKESKFAFVILP